MFNAFPGENVSIQKITILNMDTNIVRINNLSSDSKFYLF